MSKEWANPEALIKVVGVGGGGSNAVNRMYDHNMKNVQFIVANTDVQVLNISPVPNRIVLGENFCHGLGAGADPEVGAQAALESSKEIKEVLQGSQLVFVAAGMGGGTGTGAAPVIAKIARELGALTIAIVTKPFRFEGKKRLRYAEQGIKELQKETDSIIIVANDRLLELVGDVPIDDAFREADNILRQGVQTITDLIAVPSQINLDFADVRTVMKDKGKALLGIGIGSGDNAAAIAAKKAVNSALLDTSIQGARNAIVNITGGERLTLNDAYEAVDLIEQATQEELNIVFGMASNPELGDNVIVTIIATGFDDDEYLSPSTNLNLNTKISKESSVSPPQSFSVEEPVIEQTEPSIIKVSDEEVEIESTMTNFTFNNDDEDDIPSFVQHK